MKSIHHTSLDALNIDCAVNYIMAKKKAIDTSKIARKKKIEFDVINLQTPFLFSLSCASHKMLFEIQFIIIDLFFIIR